MFLSKNYILANEIVQKMGIHIANISMLVKQLEHDNAYSDYVKLNNCTFLNKKSRRLPNNITDGIHVNEFTDMSNKIPVTYFHSEHDITEREIMKSDIIKGKVKISGKNFYEFTDDFVKKTKNCVLYTLSKQETEDCLSKKQITGYVKIAKDKFLTWYPLYN